MNLTLTFHDADEDDLRQLFPELADFFQTFGLFVDEMKVEEVE